MMKPQPPETKLFKDWPSNPIEQRNLLAEHMREGLEEVGRRKSDKES